MGQKADATKPARTRSGPVLAREREVAKTEAINALLTRPIAVLPANIGDPVRPFALGLWNDIRPLLKPDISVSALRRAMATYVHSRSYQIAVARAGSVRHNINGEPVERVSEADRLNALRKYEGFQARYRSSKPTSTSPAQPTKTEAIQTALLRRKENPR
ncbi:ProQ/FINO family protein [Ensifer sp. B1-9]|uniref:ProQ/FINO family protein n=1 Tax=Ensifer sp. B1-9 TaxID=3141455 RepID=UPI003D21E121